MSNSKEKFQTLFEKLDTNKDGIIDAIELKSALKSLSQDINVKELLKSADNNSDEQVNIEEFLEYMNEKEETLKVAFNQLDRNNDGMIDAMELKLAVNDLGVKISLKDAETLLLKLDKDNDFSIDFEEWREFLQLTEVKNLREMLAMMCHSSSFDLGDGIGAIPDDFSWEDVVNGTVGRTIISGVSASCVSRTVTAPLERLKTYLQAAPLSKKTHTPLLHVLKSMFQEGGMLALWRGNAVNCVKIAPETATRSCSYWFYKQQILHLYGDGQDITPGQRFAAGSMAGATTAAVFYPLETIKTRMCLRQTGQYTSTFDCIRSLLKQGGVPRLYRGCSAHLLAVVPYSGTDLTLFECFKAGYMKYYSESSNSVQYGDTPPVYVSLSAGAVSSLCGQLLTYPLALARTRMQMSEVTSSSVQLRQILRETVQVEGFVGLYRGLLPNLLKAIPSVSISYAIFDQLRGYFGVKTY